MTLPLWAWKLIGIGVLAALLGLHWWHYTHLIASTAKLRNELSQTQDALRQTQEDYQRLDALMVEKLAEEQATRDTRAQRRQSLRELQREDQTVAQWADMPIPQRVRDIDQPDAAASPGERADGAVPDRRAAQDPKRGDD